MTGDVVLPADGALLIRVWTEAGDPGRVRARVIVSGDPDRTGWSTVAGESAVLDAVRAWLRTRVEGGDRP